MAIADSISRLTSADYLEVERNAEHKSEFVGGKVYAMSGGTQRHSVIAVNIASELRAQLKGKPSVAYNSDMRIKIEMVDAYTYPDISVACGEKQFEDAHEDVLLNPVVIVEVLSPSREAYDRGEKFEMYRRIPSLREYLLISQEKQHVDQFIRQPSGEWLLRDFSGLDAKVPLPSLGVTLALAEIYDNVQFD